MNDVICPWLGFKPYGEEDAPFFNGRSSAINTLLDIVEAKTITVCYAESGIGKTSLINAGLVPNIREKDFIPIWIRFDVKNFEGKTKKEEINNLLCSHILSVFHGAKKEFEEKNQPYKLIWDLPDENQGATLLDLWKSLRNTPKVSVFNGFENRDVPYKPFLILDQFEQMLYDSNSQMVIESFFELLKSLVLNDTFSEDYLRMKDNGEIKDGEDPFKVLVSLRQEYIGVLDYWCMTRVPMPSLHDNRYSLQPLTAQEARQVVLPKGYDIFEDAADQIIEIAKENNAVSSILLSVICRRLYEQTPSKEGAKLKVSEGEVEKKKESIIKDYYDDQLKKALKGNESLLSEEIIAQIEDALVSDDGKRSLLAIKNGRLQGIDFTEDIKLLLENNGIIRSDRIGENTFVELIHDRVAIAVLECKKERKEKEKEKKRIEQRRLANLKKYKSKRNILTLTGRQLLDNCGFDYSEENSRTILSGNSKSQLKNQNLSNIHSREYDGSDNVFIADILNQIVGNDKLFIHFGESPTKDGYKALGISTQLLNSQRLINGVFFYDSVDCNIQICSAEGFKGININYDAEGNEKERFYIHSEDGVNVSGVSRYEITKYTEDGFPLKVLFKDENNNPCKHYDGNYGLEFQYDEYGNEILRRYLAVDGKSPCKIYNQVCGLKSIYDDNKEKISMQYFVDENGGITDDAYGIVGVQYSYYEDTGDISGIEYIGKDRKICKNPYGYSIVKFVYKNGKRFQNRYYAEDGVTPVTRIDGELNYFILEVVGYDDCDRISGYILKDVDERPKLKMLYTYDRIGHITDTKYYADENFCSVNPSGVHHIKYDFYSNGLLKSLSYHGINGSPIKDNNGTHRVILEWDNHGRLFKRHFFKSMRENPDISEIYEYKSEAQCILRTVHFTNLEGTLLDNPIEEEQSLSVNHIFQAKEITYGENNDFIIGQPVRVKFKYNIAGDVSECSLFDVESNKPIADHEGDYGWQIEKFGVAGETRTFLNDKGNISRNKHPYAIVIRDSITYMGEECTVTSYFDENKEPVLHEDGYHKTIESSISGDELNKQVFYFDCQNNPCDCKDGYAKQVFEQENISETEIKSTVSFIGADGTQRINKKLGYHKREQFFSIDKGGLEICRLFKGEDDKLINCAEGFAKRIIKRYDSLWTLFHFPFEDHDVMRFYDENDKKVDVDFECNIKGGHRTYHAYKFIMRTDDSSFLKINNVSRKTMYRDWTKMWKCVFVVLVPLVIIIGFPVYSIYSLFKKLFNKVSHPKIIQEKTYPIIKIVQVYDEIQKGNESIVPPSKTMGIKEGCWIVRWNNWVYNKDDENAIEKFEEEFNASGDLKVITLYDSDEKRFFNLGIREKNIGIRIQDALVPDKSIDEMLENMCLLSTEENAYLLQTIYSNFARQYKEKGEYDKAEDCYRKQIAILEQRGDAVLWHDLADAYDDLGVCLSLLKSNNEAIETLERALEICGESEDETQLSAAIHDHLAQVFRTVSEFDKAEFHYKECVKRLEKIDSIPSEIIVNHLMDVGMMLARQEKYDECIEVTERALTMTTEDNLNLLRSIHSNLAYLYKEKGEFGKAEEHYRERITIMKRQGNETSPHDLADAYDDLGVCLFLLDKNEEAIKKLERALDILKESKGENQLIAAIHNHLAQVFRENEDFGRAEFHYKENIKYLKNLEGVSNDVIADILTKVGVMLVRQEKYDEAIDVTERALSLTSNENAGLLQSIHANLAFLYKEKAEYNIAEMHYREQIAIMEKQEEEVSSHNLADAYDDLGICLFLLDKNSEAIEVLEQALVIVGDSEGENQLIATIHNHLAQVFSHNKEFEKAEFHYKECVRQTECIDTISGDVLAERLLDVGMILYKQEKSDECIDVTERALSLTSNENIALLTSIHSNLASLYNKKSEYEKAENHYRERISLIEKDGDANYHYLAIAYDDLGVCLHQLNKNDEAVDNLEHALSMVETDENEAQLIAQIHQHLSQVYSAVGASEKANLHNSKYLELMKLLDENCGTDIKPIEK